MLLHYPSHLPALSEFVWTPRKLDPYSRVLLRPALHHHLH
jgi:hypothetical protein